MVDWLQVGQTSGSGDTQILIRALPYTGDTSRYTTLVLSGLTKHIDIDAIQIKVDALSISPTATTFVAGETQQFTINSNSFWNITSYPDWLTLSALSGGVGSTIITATAENDENSHKSGVITVSNYSRTATATVIKLSTDYLKFTILSGGTISYQKKIQYSLNEGAWVGSTTGVNTVNLTVNAGDVIRFRGYTGGQSRSNSNYDFVGTAKYNVSGNLMSVVDGDNFGNLYDTYNCSFGGFFANATGLLSAYALSMPATSLTDYCYYSMFSGSTVTHSPRTLPGRTLGYGSYANMFYGCSSLQSIPDFPESMWGQHSACTSMFQDCVSLTDISETELTFEGSVSYYECYNMFRGCTALTSTCKITVLPNYNDVSIMSKHCCGNMFRDCTSLVNTYTITATFMEDHCCEHMFRGCTSLIVAPELQAEYLPNDTGYDDYNGAYYAMFRDCTSLTTGPSVLPIGAGCQYMFYGCTALTTPPELPATSLTSSAYNYMFYGCTSLTTAPVLPAPSLADSSYAHMFENCRSLNYIKCLATGIMATGSRTNWVSGVASSGTFVKASGMNIWPSGSNGIPEGWTVQDAT